MQSHSHSEPIWGAHPQRVRVRGQIPAGGKGYGPFKKALPVRGAPAGEGEKERASPGLVAGATGYLATGCCTLRALQVRRGLSAWSSLIPGALWPPHPPWLPLAWPQSRSPGPPLPTPVGICWAAPCAPSQASWQGKYSPLRHSRNRLGSWLLPGVPRARLCWDPTGLWGLGRTLDSVGQGHTDGPTGLPPECDRSAWPQVLVPTLRLITEHFQVLSCAGPQFSCG